MFAMSLFISISCVLLIALLGYVYVKRKYSYWADRGVPFLPPKFPGGNMDGVGKTITVGELMQKFYFKLKGKGPVGGIYFLTKPSAVITDLELLKHVFVKTLNTFKTVAFTSMNATTPCQLICSLWRVPSGRVCGPS